ncbi:hypothetical protein vseg_005598 [Gypsophila vaccaria]
MTASKAMNLININLMTPITVLADNVPTPAAAAATTKKGFARGGDTLEEPLEVPTLVHPLDLLHPADVLPVDVHQWEHLHNLVPLLPDNALDLLHVRPVHRQIPLVGPHAVPRQYRPDRPAVLVRPPHHPQARVVHHHPGLTVRRRPPLGLGLGLGLSGPGPGPVEDGGGGVGAGAVGLGDEGLDVLQGAAGRARVRARARERAGEEGVEVLEREGVMESGGGGVHKGGGSGVDACRGGSAPPLC